MRFLHFIYLKSLVLFKTDMLTSQSAASVVPNHVPSSPIHTVRSNGTSGDHRAQQLLETGIIGPITGVVETSSKEIEEFGKGLRNEIGQYNCFLNVVIQVESSSLK